MQGCSTVRARRQESVASASSDPCIRLDMRLLPLSQNNLLVSATGQFQVGAIGCGRLPEHLQRIHAGLPVQLGKGCFG